MRRASFVYALRVNLPFVNNPIAPSCEPMFGFLLSPAFTTTVTAYAASIARLGWINCGQNAGSSPTSSLTFASTVDDLTNVGIFVYFPATKTVMQVYNMSSLPIPNGSNVKIICIAVDASGNLFSYDNTKTINSNEQIDVTMVATTDAALTTFLNGL